MKKVFKVAGPYVLALAALVIGLVGLRYPIPIAPIDVVAVIETDAGGDIPIGGVDGAVAYSLSGGTSNMTSLELSEDLTVNGDAAIVGTLTLDGVAMSGPLAFGSATSVISGTTIAHGVGTTPTAALLTVGSSGGFTTTFPYVLAMGTVSITVGVADAVTLTTVYWLAGK